MFLQTIKKLQGNANVERKDWYAAGSDASGLSLNTAMSDLSTIDQIMMDLFRYLS